MHRKDIGARIKQIRLYYGVTQEDICQALGITQGHYSKLESGPNEPTETFLLAMKARFGVDPNWVLTGEGEMLISSEKYIAEGIELLGDQKFSEGLIKVLEDPRFAKLHSLVEAGGLVDSDIDEELAAYLRYILKNWHESERKRHWVMGQLEVAFRDVKQEE
ncbi:MAG: helix-turn-helix transcriptional regulator [Firmicutes bacterium]|nr:helix-turn-helix transcriptional regulator [Bacillota bacterium]